VFQNRNLKYQYLYELSISYCYRAELS